MSNGFFGRRRGFGWPRTKDLRDARGPGRVTRRFGCGGTIRLFSGGVAADADCQSDWLCGTPRTVAFIYYPNAPSDTFPRQYQFVAEAQKERSKYGFVDIHVWDNWTD